MQKGLPRSRWLRQLGVTDQLVEWAKPIRPPLHLPAWLTPELFAALPAVLCVRELRYRVAQAGFRTWYQDTFAKVTSNLSFT